MPRCVSSPTRSWPDRHKQTDRNVRAAAICGSPFFLKTPADPFTGRERFCQYFPACISFSDMIYCHIGFFIPGEVRR